MAPQLMATKGAARRALEAGVGHGRLAHPRRAEEGDEAPPLGEQQLHALDHVLPPDRGLARVAHVRAPHREARDERERSLGPGREHGQDVDSTTFSGARTARSVSVGRAPVRPFNRV